MSHISSHLTNNVNGSDVYCQDHKIKQSVFQGFGYQYYYTSMRKYLKRYTAAIHAYCDYAFNHIAIYQFVLNKRTFPIFPYLNFIVTRSSLMEILISFILLKPFSAFQCASKS